MNGMRIWFFLALLLVAMPLAGQPRESGAGTRPGATPGTRRVFAPCELTSASLGPSGQQSDTEGRGFAIHIMNGSASPIVLPSSPEFGWRVETLEDNRWKVKSEGGPVRRIRAGDPHLTTVGQSGAGPMVQIAPDFARDYYFYLPEADQALRHDGKLTTLRLSVYWAASAEMQRASPAPLACAIAADWTIRIRPNPGE
jgi:hypothetical protein